MFKNKNLIIGLFGIVLLIVIGYALTTLNKDKVKLLQVEGYLFSCTNQPTKDSEKKELIGTINENLDDLTKVPTKDLQSNFLAVGSELYWWDDGNISNDGDMEGVTTLIDGEYKVCRPHITNPNDFFNN